MTTTFTVQPVDVDLQRSDYHLVSEQLTFTDALDVLRVLSFEEPEIAFEIDIAVSS